MESWMLARFIVPVAKLDELEAFEPAKDWRVSVLASADLESDLARIGRSPLQIDTIEIKASDQMGRRFPAGLTPYFEITDLALLPAIRTAGARAKIRTGGVTPDAFPSASYIARFLEACAQARVAFKATAGLHHPLRCYRALTYASGGPSGWMYGFLNVFVAAVLARKGIPATELEPVLLDESPTLRGLTAEEIADARREFAISFGSCSFEEPVADLKALNLI